MADLTSNQKSFIERMTTGENFAREGFELLSKRDDAEKFFDALHERRLLDPSQNSGPKPATQPDSYYEPYWAALDYLLAVAKKADAINDVALGNKVMGVVRTVSTWKDPETNVIRENSATFWRFAEILGQVPTACVTAEDIQLVAVWMSARFNRGMAGHALVQFAIPHFLNGETVDDKEKACLLLWECSAFRWQDGGRFNHEVELVLESHWFEQLLARYAKDFAIKAGARSADIFYRRLTDLFAHEKRRATSTLWRPAVEAHQQNRRWHEVENRLVDGLRDILNAWVDTGDDAAANFVAAKLQDKTEMVRRVAFHVVDEHFPQLGDRFLNTLSSQTFGIGHIHEVYRLLTRHFGTMEVDQQRRIVDILRNLPMPENVDDAANRQKHVQRLWLSAIAGRGSQEADTWFTDMQKDPAIGGLGEHPDFLSYHESRWGPGPSPMAVENIVAFAQEGTLVQQLNDFTEKDSWRGPTLGGLCSTVEQAVADEPSLFLSMLSSFQAVKVPYQHSVLNGLKRAFETSKDKESKVDWPNAWPAIFQFSHAIISQPAFWEAESTPAGMELIPRRAWLATLVSDLIQSAARDDVRGYKRELYPQIRDLLVILLERSEALTELSDTTDAVNLSINSGKGRAVEALLNHALKECRITNQEGSGHEQTWEHLQPLFDSELAKCKNGNFEFSTLASQYFANLEYMSASWLTANIKRLFPVEYPTNIAAAVDGLAYAPASGSIYKQLHEAGVIAWALSHNLGDHGRERLVERIILAYMWKLEPIDGTTMAAIISPSRLQDIETAADFLWRAQGESFGTDQLDLIFQFWDASVTMLDSAKITAPGVRSSLSRLTVFIRTIGERERRLLMSCAPFVQTDYNAGYFIEQLDRLAPDYPAVVAQALQLALQSYILTFDAKDQLFGLIVKLAERGQRQAALEMTAILQSKHPKALELYQKLNEMQ